MGSCCQSIIRLEILDGKDIETIQIEGHFSLTGRQVKDMVYAKYDYIPIDSITLSWEDKEIPDDGKICDYNVVNPWNIIRATFEWKEGMKKPVDLLRLERSKQRRYNY